MDKETRVSLGKPDNWKSSKRKDLIEHKRAKKLRYERMGEDWGQCEDKDQVRFLYSGLEGVKGTGQLKAVKARKNKKDNELEEAAIGCQNITEWVRVRDVDTRVLDVVVPMKCDSECGMALRESECAEWANVGQAEYVRNMRSVKPKKVWTKLRNGLFGWRVEKVGRQRLKESVNQSEVGLESSSAVKNIFTKKLNIF